MNFLPVDIVYCLFMTVHKLLILIFFFLTLCGSVRQMKTFFSFFLPPLCVVQVLWSVCPPHSVAQWTDCIKVQSKHSSWVFVFVSICRFVCISPHRPAVNQELSNLFNELWRLDVNRMTPGTDYTVSVQVRSQSSFRPHLYLYVIVLYVIILICFQGRASFVTQGSHVVQDHASLPLFSNVNETKLMNTTTIAREWHKTSLSQIIFWRLFNK